MEHAARICPMCETRPGHWNEPASAERPEEAEAEAVALERRVAELEASQATVHELHRKMLAMCSMCREIVADVDAPADLDEAIARIRYRVARLRELAQTCTAHARAG